MTLLICLIPLMLGLLGCQSTARWADVPLPPTRLDDTGRVIQPNPSALDTSVGVIDKLARIQTQVDRVAQAIPGPIATTSSAVGTILGGLALLLHGLKRPSGTPSDVAKTMVAALQASSPQPPLESKSSS
jgi:L-aminopeptidase/D-esterase-like protein